MIEIEMITNAWHYDDNVKILQLGTKLNTNLDSTPPPTTVNLIGRILSHLAHHTM